jgi:UDP-N-acetylglucosamine 2-epimerase
MTRKVCVVLVDRANYGRLKPVMFAIREKPELTLQIVCAGTMVLQRSAGERAAQRWLHHRR